MSEAKDDKPRIIVDDDWKAEARREKEESDRQTRDVPEGGELPPPQFVEIIQMLLAHATVGLGGLQDPQTGQRIPPQLPVAKHYIDLLELLGRKTVNNLDKDEKAILERALHELRMAFVQVAGVGARSSKGAGPSGPAGSPR